MHLPSGLIDAAALRVALDAELDSPSRLLPASAVAPALETKRDEVTAWIEGQVSGEFRPPPEEVVAASKARHGVRPVAVWDLPSRVLYRALANRLAPGLPALDRRRGAWRRFQRRPLAIAGKYIVTADLAACYSLIDHGLLAEELVLQTGDHGTITALTSLLQDTGGRRYGLPQQSEASDFLAEAFLDRLERALVRRGLRVGRYSDDFRLNCANWSDVVRSLEVLSEEARDLGLVLNDAKTITWTRKKYEDHLDEVEQMRNEIAAEAQLDLTTFDSDEYDGTLTLIKAEPEDVKLLTAVRVLQRWEAAAGRGRVADSKRAEHRALLELTPVALSALSAHSGTAGSSLDIAMRMIRYEQTMTPPVSRYLLTRSDEGEVLGAFDRLLRSRPYLSGWQSWWLQQPLARLTGFSAGKGGAARTRWAKAAFSDAQHSPVLRAHAAITLARHSLTDAAELLRVYDRSSPVVRPTVVAALGLLKPSASVARAVTADSKLHKWIFDWARKFA